jgi:dephospho-CoA kinase
MNCGEYGEGVFCVAIVGGIGSGKSAVTQYLGLKGAGVVDADVVAREVVQPGEPVWQQLRDAFGDAILAPDRTLDRAFVAQIVFHDPSALRRLNQITHVAIGIKMSEQVEAFVDRSVVAVALPLFREVHRDLLKLNEVWCVVASPDVVLSRLTGPRGLTLDDATARIAAQESEELRAANADVIVHNDGTLEELQGTVDGLLRDRGLS